MKPPPIIRWAKRERFPEKDSCIALTENTHFHRPKAASFADLIQKGEPEKEEKRGDATERATAKEARMERMGDGKEYGNGGEVWKGVLVGRLGAIWNGERRKNCQLTLSYHSQRENANVRRKNKFIWARVT